MSIRKPSISKRSIKKIKPQKRLSSIRVSTYTPPLLEDDEYFYHVTTVERARRILSNPPDKTVIGTMSTSWSPYAPIGVNGNAIIMIDKKRMKGRLTPMNWNGQEAHAQEIELFEPTTADIGGVLLKQSNGKDIRTLGNFGKPIFIRKSFDKTSIAYKKDYAKNKKRWKLLWETDPDPHSNMRGIFVYNGVYGNLDHRLERYENFL